MGRGDHYDGNDLFKKRGEYTFSHPVELSPRAGRRNPLIEKDGTLKPSRPLPPGMYSRSPRLEPLSYDFQRKENCVTWLKPGQAAPGVEPGETAHKLYFQVPQHPSPRPIPTRYDNSPRTKQGGATSTVGQLIFGDDSARPFGARPFGDGLAPLEHDPFARRFARADAPVDPFAKATPEQQLAMLNVALSHERRKRELALGKLTTKLRNSAFVPPNKASLCGVAN